MIHTHSSLTSPTIFTGDDPATNFSHDKAFVYTPSPLTPSMGHIHPIIYRGCKQAFYVQKQTGIKNPAPFNVFKINKMLGGSIGGSPPPAAVAKAGGKNEGM